MQVVASDAAEAHRASHAPSSKFKRTIERMTSKLSGKAACQASMQLLWFACLSCLCVQLAAAAAGGEPDWRALGLAEELRPSNLTTNGRAAKLIEWDDESEAEPIAPLAHNHLRPAPSERRLKSAQGRLIYHGRLAAASGWTGRSTSSIRRSDDGLEMRIDTHMPVVISRRSLANNWRAPGDKPAPRELLETSAGSTTTEEPTATTTTTVATIQKARRDAQLAQQESYSISNWRPIVGSPGSRQRRSEAKLRRLKQTKSNEQFYLDKKLASLELDHRWRPVGSKMGETKEAEMVVASGKSKTKGELSSRAWRRASLEEPFEDAAEQSDDRELEKEESLLGAGGQQLEASSLRVANGTSRSPRSEDGAKREPQTSRANKWTPLVTPQFEASTPNSSLASPVPSDLVESWANFARSLRANARASNESLALAAPLSSNSSASNAGEQRSSSDLNYIYSSQPQVQSVAASPPSSSSYYSNYLLPASTPSAAPAPQLPPNELTLVDTTSGQMPEMIADRAPSLDSTPASVDGYSMPLVSATFQPAPQPPVRQPSYAYSTGGYEQQTQQQLPLVASSNGNFYASAQSYRQQPSQPQRQQQLPPQVVKQEHHYHYYNANSPSLPERQATVASQAQQPAAQPTIIREIQPIMISQPVLQQQSTTQAPPPTQTIIREIVKELPAVQQQVPARLVQMVQAPVAQPPPVAVQLAPVLREVSAAYESMEALNRFQMAPTAQRIIRQLSNNLPQVNVRIPASFNQLRLQVPALQLPFGANRARQLPNAAPVTRQTGSFIIPPVPKKTTTYMTETQAMPTHTTIMQTTQFTPATRTTVYTTDHQQQANVDIGQEATRAIGSSLAPSYRS